MKTNNKALIYCRVSTKKQEREGSGLSSQEKRCREYAAFNGYEVEKVFQDSFSGGGDFMKRPAMRDLIDYVDNNLHDGYVVIFDDLKRFARDLKFHWELREAFKTRNLVPACLNFTFEETPEGSFIETIIAAQGELEREQNKRQVVQKMKARMDRGIYCMGGNAPFGYDFKKNNTYGGKVLEVNDNDAEIAREAFLGFASSKLFHIKDVAHYINSHELYKRKEKMRVESVRRMLSNILYTGYIEYLPWGIKRLKGIHQPIIPLSTYDEVQERIFGKVPQRTRIDVKEDFPLRGYVNCTHCHRPLTAAMSTSGTGKKHPYYRCYVSTCPMRHKGIPQEEIHERFKELLKKVSPKENVMKAVKLAIIKEYEIQQVDARKVLNKRVLQIKGLDDQITALINRITTNPDSPLIELYEREVIKNKHQKEILEEQLSSQQNESVEELELIINKAFEKINNPYESWVNGNLEQRKNVQKMILSDNLDYSRIESFGTPKKCYLLRLFEEIEAKNDLNFGDVDIVKNSWNSDNSNVKDFKEINPVAKFINENLEMIITNLKILSSYP